MTDSSIRNIRKGDSKSMMMMMMYNVLCLKCGYYSVFGRMISSRKVVAQQYGM